MLSLISVSKSFGRKQQSVRAVDDVSLRIERGEFVVMLGHSGAGKSTLLKLISGQLPADQGQVEIDGEPMLTWSRQKLQHRMGVVHQHFALVPRLSTLDNVLLGRLPWIPWYRSIFRHWSIADRELACQWLERVGLEPIHATRAAGQLSGGQQQRVAIARALIRQPSLILADEPVANLDPAIGREILELLREAAHRWNIAVLCNLHQPDMAEEYADRIVHMAKGKIKFDGTPSEWRQSSEMSSDYLRREARSVTTGQAENALQNASTNR
ncbi:phosphonate ABC transporter ATP-binding protein [Bremerella cremea]